ncbi:ribonuclease H-like domain-containing protein [Tanacetum coccineum]
MNNVKKGTGQREVRPVLNNALRTNHQNFSNSRRNFAPITVLTKSGIVPISTARQRSLRAAAPLSAARPINTTAPKLFVNVAKTKPNAFQKAHSLSRRPFYQQIALNNRSLNNKVNTTKVNSVNTAKGKRVTSAVGKQGINAGDPQVALKDTWIFDSGCSRHMTGNKSYLTDYHDYDGGFVAFAGNSKGGRITGKGKIKTRKLDFEDVYFVKELKFNLFSVSQMCDKKNSVLFTETECLIISHDFKLPDENQVMLKIPRKDNRYSFDLKNVVPSKGLTCLIAKSTNDESNVWHRRLGHINFKTMNKLVKGNLVRGLPSKIFENDHSCVACQKGKQHKPSCKSKLVNSVSQPLQILHMDLFGPTFVKSIIEQVTILNTLDHLGKFDGKADEGFLVSYSINSKAFRVFNSRTMKVEENLHVNFLENKPNVAGSGPKWLFDIDILTNSMNYQPVSARNKTNGNAGLETNPDARQARKENVSDQEYILLPLLHTSSNIPSNSKKDELNTVSSPLNIVSSPLNTVSSPVNTVSSSFTTVDPRRAKEQRKEYESLFNPLIPDLEDTANLQDTGIFGSAYDDEYVGAEADLNNLETNMSVSPIPTTRIHKDHPKA